MLPLAIIPKPVLDVLDGILQFWEGIFGSWGLAIIFLTFTIRLLILPLTFKSVKAMQKLQVLQPEMKKIQERFKDDKQRMNQEMMKFYQENKVNPLGSCLPLLLQIPFFISLFELLRSDSFQQEIKGSESFFFGFIPDLANPLYPDHLVALAVMIVLYVGTQVIASLITTVGGDKNQQRIMLALPFVFVIFILRFQAGLILYWITTNFWTIGQQLVVKKLYPKPALVGADGVDAPAKPAPAAVTAAASGSGGANGGSAAPPPAAPRKKKKRSGRRR